MKKDTVFEILNVGTELLLGDIVNTDAAYLSARLAELGFSVYRQSVVGDNPARLRETIREAFSRADALIITGGLGPTADDITKEIAADYFGLPLREDPEALRVLTERFARMNRPMTDNNRRQAMMPVGARMIPNDYGTAPGVFYEDDATGKAFFLLPGPPGEMEPMFETQVRPLLEAVSGTTIRSLNLHVRELGESRVESILAPLIAAAENPTVAPYVGNGDVRVRITARAKDGETARLMNEEMATQIMETEVGPLVAAVTESGEDARLMPALGVIRFFADHGLTAATAESCTGGLVSARLADIPGSSAVLLGGVVSYANEVKENVLGVKKETLLSFGAVSEETAREMAAGARRLTGASVSVSTTGIAGPGGGTAEKPVGTVCFGVSSERGTFALRKQFSPRLTREEIRRRAANEALFLLLAEGKALLATDK